ncbi:MAG: efflux RND transporter periplasmic adaptor subunit [Rhizobiales bacterium]|nr:efflux RND transporter periplasmic adaptor subunit [Hyphomicrobiales bacterium]
MTKRMIYMLATLAVVFGLVFLWVLVIKPYFISQFLAARADQAQTVASVKAAEAEWSETVRLVGTLNALRGTELAAEVSGVVTNIHFEAGQNVKAGDVLIELRADSDIAKLNSLKATQDLAQRNFNRSASLLKKGNVSRSTYDSQYAALNSAKANVAEQQALVDKKIIRAPFDGVVGIKRVDLGAFVNVGTDLVTLQQLDPIHIDLVLPQQKLSVIHVDEPVSVTSDAYPGMTFTGKVTGIDPKVDPDTRNFRVQATIENPDRKLVPGMFATAEITVGEPKKLIMLPQTAITYNAYGETVFVVQTAKPKEGETEVAKNEDGTPRQVAVQKFVTVGQTRGDQVAILKGISPGDEVVSSGQLKLKNGTRIVINNSVTLPNEADPQVQDE